MSTFAVSVIRINDILNHPNADAIEIAVVGGYRSIVRLNTFKKGDLAVYIPEGAVIPETVLKRLGMWDEDKGKGRLAGRTGDRVKAAKLRGVISQGILLEVDDTMTEGMEVSGLLGITKYEPPIPSNMAGEVCNLFGHTLKFDIENIQSHPDVLEGGEPVYITEKLHGTWTCFGFDPRLEHDEVYEGGTIITSKGMSGQGLAFKWNEANKTNLYVQMFEKYLKDTPAWEDLKARARKEDRAYYLLGETFGAGVQDLNYGLKDKQFRAFGLYAGAPGHGRFFGYLDFRDITEQWGIERVPTLYHGPFSMEKAEDLRDGKDSITGVHMREGIVITTMSERYDPTIGRVCMKFVSPDYLLRKGNATEYN